MVYVVLPLTGIYPVESYDAFTDKLPLTELT